MTVVLLDEIEKAHPDFYKYHLNVFEDGEARPGPFVLPHTKYSRAGARRLRLTLPACTVFWGAPDPDWTALIGEQFSLSVPPKWPAESRS